MALLRRGSAGRAESGGVGGEGVEDRDNSHDFWYGAVRPLGDELHLDQAPRRDALGYGPHAAAAQLSGWRRTCGGEGGSAWLRDPAPHPPPVSLPMSASHPPVLSPQQDAATVAKSSAKRRRELMAGAVGWSLRALAVPPCCPHCFYSPGTVAAWGFPGCGVGPGRGSCFVFSTCFDRSRAGGGSGALGTRSTCCGTRRGHPVLPSQPTYQ